MTIRKTAKWIVILLLLTACVGAGYGWWFYKQSDELLRAEILKIVAKMAPNCKVRIDRARFDWSRRIHIHGVTVTSKDGGETVVRLPEVVITVDREALANEQRIDVRHIRLVRPQVDLVRSPDGSWNWQALLPLEKSKEHRPCPEWEIETATVRIRLDHGAGIRSSTLLAEQVEAKLVPSGKRRYLIQGKTKIDHAGTVSIDGQWDLDGQSFVIDGKVHDVAVEHKLLELIAGTSPELRTKLARVETRLKSLVLGLNTDAVEPTVPTKPGSIPFSLASQSDISEDSPSPDNGSAISTVPDFGITATVDVNFRIARWKPGAEPKFKMLFDVKNGRIENPLLPFPLHDLAGKIYWDNRQLLLRDFHCKSGMTSATIEGRVTRSGLRTPAQFKVELQNIPLNKDVRDRLKPNLQKTYDTLRPTGHADVSVTLKYDEDGTWKRENLVLTSRDISINHVRFPMRITNLAGTIRQRGADMDIQFQGRAGRSPIHVRGVVIGGGPEAEATFDIRTQQLPINEEFWAACPENVRTNLRPLNLTGNIDAVLRLHRPAGPAQVYHPDLIARVKDATIEYRAFPYRLEQFEGTITYSGDTRAWKFRDLKAQHNTTRVTAAGSLSKRSDGLQVLRLAIDTLDARCDDSLRRALPDNLKDLWAQLSPSGKLSASINLAWIPGQPPLISLPSVKLTEGKLLLKAFPLPLDHVSARLSYTDGRVDIREFSARHDQTVIQGKGFSQFEKDGSWRIRLQELTADDLVSDRSLRRALPESLHAVVETLHPDRPFSLAGMLEFRGSGRPTDAITAAWDVEVVLTGNTLDTGTTLEAVHGAVTSRGTWDGRRAEIIGQLDIDSLKILGYELTHVRGPYEFSGSQLYVGSPAAFSPRVQAIPLTDRITANAIGGQLTFDAAVRFDEETAYNLKLYLSQGQLEEYARRYMAGARSLRGIMTGWVDLHGTGTTVDDMKGRGQFRIRPAALYELPVIAQVLKVMVLSPPDKTAFNYAFTDFTVGNSRFNFNVIDLVGDTITLRGRGTAGFDGKLNIEFFSMLSRKQLSIPLLGALVGQFTTGWIGVEVTGDVRKSETKIKPGLQIDEAMKRFLGSFEARQPAAVPRLTIPPIRGRPRGIPTTNPNAPRRNIPRRP